MACVRACVPVCGVCVCVCEKVWCVCACVSNYVCEWGGEKERKKKRDPSVCEVRKPLNQSLFSQP